MCTAYMPPVRCAPPPDVRFMCTFAVDSAPSLTILAPGVAIQAAGITLTGTSQATPFVAGALVVLHEKSPASTPAQLVKRLTSTGVMVSADQHLTWLFLMLDMHGLNQPAGNASTFATAQSDEE